MTSKNKHPDKQTFQHQPNSGKQITVKAIHQEFQGPIPPPEILAAYNQIIPGGADRILKQAESETAHRQSLEKKAIDAEIEGLKNEALDVRRGQIFGLIIGLTTIISGTICAVNGASVPAIFIGTSGVVGLVSAFIIGRKQKAATRPDEQKEIAPIK